MGNIEFPKQLYLTDFSGILKSGIIIGKYIGAVRPGHFIQRLIAALGQNDGVRRFNSSQIFRTRLPSGTGDIFISFK